MISEPLRAVISRPSIVTVTVSVVQRAGGGGDPTALSVISGLGRRCTGTSTPVCPVAAPGAVVSPLVVVLGGVVSDTGGAPGEGPTGQAVRRERAAALPDVGEVLVPEHADAGRDGGRDGRAQDADRGLRRRPRHAGRDVVADVHQQVEVLGAPLARLDALHDLLDPAPALPARRALPAGLAVEEADDAPRGPHDAGRLVHGGDRPGPGHGADLGDLLVGEQHVEVLGSEPGRRHAAGDERLELAVLTDAAAEGD